jgi:hypothetical protein
VLLAARAGLWVSRRVLWVFMQAAQRVSSLLSRHAEIDADRYSARLMGSEAAASTLNEIAVAEVALGVAKDYAARADTPLPDDLFALAGAYRFDDRTRQEVVAQRAAVPRQWFDTHPSHADRLACIAGEASKGVLLVEGPAARLIPSLARLSRELTLRFYRSATDIDLEKHPPASTLEIVAGFDRYRDRAQAADRFLFGLKERWRQFGLPGSGESVPPNEAAAVAADTGARLEEARERIAALLEEDNAAWYRAQEARLAATLLDLGVQARPASPWRDCTNAAAPRAAREEAQRRRDAIAEEVLPLQRLVSRRLAACLALLDDPSVAAGMPDAASVRERVQRLGAALEALVSARPVFLRLGWSDTVVRTLMAAGIPPDDGARHDRICRDMSRLRKEMTSDLEELQALFANVPWPFDDATPEAMLFHGVVPAVPSSIDAHDTLNATGRALSVSHDAYHRVMTELTEIATAALEAAL